MRKMHGLRLRVSTAVKTSAIGLAVVIGALGYFVFNSRSDDGPNVGVIRQTARAAVGDLTLALSEAEFSGTDTLVSFEIQDSEGAGSYAFNPEDLQLNGFQGSYSDGAVHATSSGVFRLPPISLGGTPVLTIAKVQKVGQSGKTEDQLGPWVLPVGLPELRTLREMMAVQRLAAPSISADGISVSATAIRSRNSTEVTYSVPDGFMQLRLPQMVVPDKNDRFAPFRDRNNGDGTHTASFTATGFIAPIRLEFGPFSKTADATDEARIALDVDAIRSAGTSGEATRVQILGTNEGNASLVLEAHVTRRPGLPAHLALVLKGNWPSGSDPLSGAPIVSWEVIDADGHSMKEDGWQENYSTDAAGTIGYGTTTLFVIYDDKAALPLRSVTVRTTKKAEIVRGPWSLTLNPP